jgi:hypothetical protein
LYCVEGVWSAELGDSAVGSSSMGSGTLLVLVPLYLDNRA